MKQNWQSVVLVLILVLVTFSVVQTAALYRQITPKNGRPWMKTLNKELEAAGKPTVETTGDLIDYIGCGIHDHEKILKEIKEKLGN